MSYVISKMSLESIYYYNCNLFREIPMLSFRDAQPFIEKWEKGIDDNPNDSGGVTKNGICIRFLRDLAESNRDFVESIGLKLPITRQTILNLTKEQETRLFKFAFWDKIPDAIENMTRMVMYDSSVNCGKGQATKFLQRACNNFEGTVVAVDGGLGKLTTARVVQLQSRGLDIALANSMIDFRERFYNGLVAAKPSQKVFLKGWMNRINDLRRFIMS